MVIVVETHAVDVGLEGRGVEGGGVVGGGGALDVDGDKAGDADDPTTHLHLLQQSCFAFPSDTPGSMAEHWTEMESQKPSHCLRLEMSAHPSR